MKHEIDMNFAKAMREKLVSHVPGQYMGFTDEHLYGLIMQAVESTRQRCGTCKNFDPLVDNGKCMALVPEWVTVIDNDNMIDYSQVSATDGTQCQIWKLR